MTTREKISPLQLAARWGIDVRKVLHWIHSGELRAINVAKDRHHKRPQFRIDEKDIAEFEQIRDATHARSNRTRQRKERRVKPSFLQLV